MKYLLDTNIFIWFLNGDDLLGSKYINIIKNINNDIYLSIVSVWEIAIKDSLKKIELKYDFEKIFSDIIEKNNINVLGLNIEHIKRLRKLPFHHRDPFDRIIIAQSIAENIELLYTDKLIKKYI